MIAQANPVATITLKTPHVNQVAVLKNRNRFRVVACGRRWGKSETAIIACAYRLLKGQHIWYCSPTHKNNKRVWRKFKAVFGNFPQAHISINNSDYRIELRNGGFIEMVSLHEPDNLRGEGLDFAVIDEAAFIEVGVWDSVLRPMLLDGEAMMLSSTNGRNEFWTWYNRGLDPSEPEWSSQHFTAYDNPLIRKTEIDDIQRNTPERVFEQEYLAKFLEDGGAVFRNVNACVDKTIIINREKSIYPVAQGQIVIGVDLGRDNDYTRLYAMDVSTHRIVDYDGFTDTAWEIQRHRIGTMAQRWNPEIILIEENFNDSFVERLQGDGLPVASFRTTAQSKQQIINALSLAFEQSDIHIPDESGLLHELQIFTIVRLPSGTLRYAAPSGFHDDRVMALALTWRAATQMALEFKGFW